MTSVDAMDVPWFTYHENLVTLTRYMAENEYSAEQVAYAVEKPWKFDEEFELAQADTKGELVEE